MDRAEDGSVRRTESCFAAGTPLQAPAGSKLVEDFVPGDLILSRDQDRPDGPVEAKVVEAVFRRSAPIMHLHVGGRVIRTTAEHPFYAFYAGWVRAGDLKAGDWLLGMDGGWTAVEETFDTGVWEDVYNLRVADNHTYFVGCEDWGFSVWAHNACTPEEIAEYARNYADITEANAGEFYKAWDKVALGRILSAADQRAIRRYIRDNPEQFPGVRIKPRNLGGADWRCCHPSL